MRWRDEQFPPVISKKNDREKVFDAAENNF